MLTVKGVLKSTSQDKVTDSSYLYLIHTLNVATDLTTNNGIFRYLEISLHLNIRPYFRQHQFKPRNHIKREI